jgi:hypothetical protein
MSSKGSGFTGIRRRVESAVFGKSDFHLFPAQTAMASGLGDIPLSSKKLLHGLPRLWSHRQMPMQYSGSIARFPSFRGDWHQKRWYPVASDNCFTISAEGMSSIDL